MQCRNSPLLPQRHKENHEETLSLSKKENSVDKPFEYFVQHFVRSVVLNYFTKKTQRKPRRNTKPFQKENSDVKPFDHFVQYFVHSVVLNYFTTKSQSTKDEP